MTRLILVGRVTVCVLTAFSAQHGAVDRDAVRLEVVATRRAATKLVDGARASRPSAVRPISQEEHHPQVELLDRPAGVPVLTLGTSTLEEPVFVERLRRARRIAVAGAAEKEDEIFFGRIDSAAIGPRGRVFVLDSQVSQVAVLRLDASVAETFGRRGQGPGEFSSPDAIALDATADRLFVGDRNGRVHIFSTAGDKTEPLDTLYVGRSLPESLCTVHGSLAVGSRDFSGGLVRVLAADGSVQEAFGGVLYHSPHALVNRTVSAFAMACDSATSTAFLAVSLLGEVRAVREGGGVEWIAVAGDFQSPPVVFLNGRISLRSPFEQTLEQMVAVAHVGDIVIAQKMTWVLHRDRSFDATYVTYVLDPETGESWIASDQLPKILAVNETHLVTEESGENPFVGIYELGSQ